MLLNSIIFIMLAGFMNGTYAFPIKYIKSWKDENIWLVFSVIAFLIMPWICLTFIYPQVIEVIRAMPKIILMILISGGFFFGIGMVIFTFSLRYVGIGISFMLNISSSTVIASLLPIVILTPKRLLSWFGFAEIVALILFCIAMLFSYLASCYKFDNKLVGQAVGTKKNAIKGVVLGILSGVLTSAQGFSYAYATTILQTLSSSYSEASIMNAPWIPIFTTAFIPYFSYFLLKCIHDKSLKNIVTKPSIGYIPFCIIMGILYFGSLLLFGHASASLGQMGVVIAWPMLMIFIILTSNLWSFVHREWKDAKQPAFNYLSISLISLILAIGFLSLASYMNK